jgi:hypothetical protein
MPLQERDVQVTRCAPGSLHACTPASHYNSAAMEVASNMDLPQKLSREVRILQMRERALHHAGRRLATEGFPADGERAPCC